MLSTAFILAAFLASSLAGSPPQGGSSGGSAASTPPATSSRTSEQQNDQNDLPISLDKIQKALARHPSIQIPIEPVDSDNGLPTFRIHVDAEKLTIEQILGPDYLRGPVPYGGMTHQEFLNMVTPRDVQGYAAFSNTEGITVALTSLALHWALKTALHEFQEAKDARAKEAARKEVQEALEALRRARRDAGLPDK